MTEELEHLHPTYRPYAQLPNDERIQWIRHDRWIGYERADRILARLADLLTYPPRDGIPAMLIFGATGMSKARIVQKFLRDHRSTFDEGTGVTRLPVPYVQMPPSPPNANCTKSSWSACRMSSQSGSVRARSDDACASSPPARRPHAGDPTRFTQCSPAPFVSSGSSSTRLRYLADDLRISPRVRLDA